MEKIDIAELEVSQEKTDIAELEVNKRVSLGTRMERASARHSEVIVKENRKFYKYLLAAGAVLVFMVAAQFGMNIVAVSLEKEIFVTAQGTGPQTMQDRAGNPLIMPVAMEKIEPFEGLPLMGPEGWDATTNLNLLSEDGTLHGFRLSGWRLEEDKTEVGAYQLNLMTVSGATLTYARSLRPRPAAGAYVPFEWASSGDNVIRIQDPDGRETLALQEGSGRRLQNSVFDCHKVKDAVEAAQVCYPDRASYPKKCNGEKTADKKAACVEECETHNTNIADCAKKKTEDQSVLKQLEGGLMTGFSIVKGFR